MRIVLALLVSFALVTCVSASEVKTNDLVCFDTDNALKKARLALFKQYPEYSKSDLRLIEMAARYRPSESKNVYIEVSFINMDTIGNIKEDLNVWTQPSTGRKKSGLIYEHIVVKLESSGSVGDSVRIINMKYPGTKEQLIDSMKHL